jgi:hypothetical protein
LKLRGNKLIKSFSFNIKNKILKKTNYNLKDFITYNYEKIKKKAFNIYIYKKKRKYYIKIINSKYIKLRKKYLNIII